VPIVLKSGSLSFLEPSGPVQGCNGTALPLHRGKRGKADWFSHIWYKNCLVKHVIERVMEGKWRAVDEKEDVSSYWMTLRKRGDTGD